LDETARRFIRYHFQLQRSRMMLSQAKGFTLQGHEFMQDIAKKDYEDDSAGITPALSEETDTIIALHFILPTYLTRMELGHDGIRCTITAVH
jgi:hypothetical protein